MSGINGYVPKIHREPRIQVKDTNEAASNLTRLTLESTGCCRTRWETHHEVGREQVVVVEPVPAVLLALALLGAVPGVGPEDLLEVLEAGQQVARVQGLSRRAGRLQHPRDVLGPEVPVGRVDLGDVAEQLRPVDLAQDVRGLQSAQTRHEQLFWKDQELSGWLSSGS